MRSSFRFQESSEECSTIHVITLSISPLLFFNRCKFNIWSSNPMAARFSHRLRYRTLSSSEKGSFCHSSSLFDSAPGRPIGLWPSESSGLMNTLGSSWKYCSPKLMFDCGDVGLSIWSLVCLSETWFWCRPTSSRKISSACEERGLFDFSQHMMTLGND